MTMKRALGSALSIGALVVSFNASALDLSAWNEREAAVFEVVNQQRAHHGFEPLLADARLHNAARAHSQDMLDRDFFSHETPNNVDASERVTAAGYAWASVAENIAAGSGRRFSGGSITQTAPDDAARQVMYGTSDLQTVRDFVGANGLGDTSAYDWSDVGRGWSQANWAAWDSARNGSGGWMGSPGHRRNILESGYTDLGVGYVFSASDGGSTDYHTYWTQNFASGDSRPGEQPSPGPQPPPDRTEINPQVLQLIVTLMLDDD